MKILAWFQMSILVAIVISWPLVIGFGVDKQTVGGLSLIGGAILMWVMGRKRASHS